MVSGSPTFLSLPVVATPWLAISTAATTTTASYVKRLDVSVERVEVQRRQTADGGLVTDEDRVAIMSVKMNGGAAGRRDAAAAVQLTDLSRVDPDRRQLRLVDNDCWTMAAVVR